MPINKQYIDVPIVDGVNHVITAIDNTLFYKLYGTAVLTSNWSVTVGAGAIDGMRCHFTCLPNVTLGGNHMYICGAQVPDNLATKNFEALACYYTSGGWSVRFAPDFEETGIIVTDDIADNAVTNDKLNDMTRGTVKIGGVANAPTDLNGKTSGQILMGDGTDVVSLAITGDIGITGAGVVTIANDAVNNNKLDNIPRGYVKVGGVANAPTDLNAKTSGYILIGDGTDILSVPVTGDVSITPAGVTTVTGVGPVEDGTGTGSVQTKFAVTGSTAVADYSISLGDTNATNGISSVAIGSNNSTTNDFSVALGTANTNAGQAAVTIGQSNSSTTQGDVAIGFNNTSNNGVTIGTNNTASNASTAIGSGNTSSGDGSCALNKDNYAKGQSSLAIGQEATAPYDGTKAFSSGYIGTSGDAQKIDTILKVATTNNIADYLQLLDGTDGITIPTDCTTDVYIRLVAVQTGGVAGTIGDSFTQIIKLAANNIAGVSAVIPTAAVTLANYDVESGDVLYEIPFKTAAFGGSAVVTVAANKLQIAVTGENNKDIQWIAHVSMVWTGYRNFSI